MKINPIRELLKAGEIIGLSPREMTLIALEQLIEEEREHDELPVVHPRPTT